MWAIANINIFYTTITKRKYYFGFEFLNPIQSTGRVLWFVLTKSVNKGWLRNEGTKISKRVENCWRFYRMPELENFLNHKVNLILEIAWLAYWMSQIPCKFHSIPDCRGSSCFWKTPPGCRVSNYLRWPNSLKNVDIHQKLEVFKNIIFKPLNTCEKHFQTILLNFPLDECKIQGKYTVV